MLLIGKRLRILREIRGYSQEYMSQALCITQSAYSKIERGEVKIDMSRLEKIAKVLKLETFDLIDGSYTINIYPQGSIAREDIEIKNDHENSNLKVYEIDLINERNRLLSEQVKMSQMQIERLTHENHELTKLLRVGGS